jgi:hypothetical protein
MPKKFKPDLMEDIKTVARDINDNVLLAYDVKKKEIEENYIPESAKAKLTPAEIKRAERAGLVIGVIVILAILLGIVWWIWR